MGKEKYRKLLDHTQKELNTRKMEGHPHYEADQSVHYWLDLTLREGIEQAITEYVSYFD